MQLCDLQHCPFPLKQYQSIFSDIDDIQEDVKMARKRHRAEQIVNKLRRVDVELSKGSSVAQAC